VNHIFVKGKRIRVRLENLDRHPITKDYHYILKNALLTKLEQYDESLSVKAHDQWNTFFVFSGFLGKLWNTEIGLLFKSVEISIASSDLDIIYGLSRAMVIDRFLYLGNVRLLVSQIKVEDFHIPDGISSIDYETLGEIVIKKGEKTGITHHIDANDDIAKAIKETIERQSKAATGISGEIDVEVVSSVQKKRAIYKNSTLVNSFTALRLSFKVKADARVHEFLLTQGIGHHRKMGFGMLSVKRRGESTK
jgi:CRISPR-associated endoribonuclease Cas6